MGVHLITSEAAKSYAAREKIIGKGITLLGKASEKASSLDKEVLEKIGDLAAELVPHAPGHAGKLFHVAARFCWALAGVGEKEAKVVPIEELEKKIQKLENEVK